MSAEANIVFFGIRIPMSEMGVEAIDPRKHPLVVRARSFGLSFHLSNFGGVVPLYYLFIGKSLGLTGPEHVTDVQISAQEVEEAIAFVSAQLPAAGFSEEPKLFIQWIPDA